MKHGFSLVELSIVLVILGLLTGGILAGQSLIRAAEIRAITSEHSRYLAAIHTFRDKYFALPGDFSKAEDFWDTMATGTCPNATAGSGTETCNGDADGLISRESASASQANEEFTAWQHLANAGLIEGSYTGIAGSSSAVHQLAGENVPRSKLNDAVWYIGTNTYSSHGVYTDGYFPNFLSIGGAGTGNITNLAILSPEEAWNIDTKIDDGIPQQGKVWAIGWDDCTNAGTAAATDGEYALTTTTTECGLLFLTNY